MFEMFLVMGTKRKFLSTSIVSFKIVALVLQP